MLLNLLLAVLIIVGIALIGLVLLQRSEGGALGMGGGGQLVSARGAATFLTRTTWILGGIFFVLCLAITLVLGRTAGTGSITEQMKLSIDPAKIAAEQKALIEAEKAKQGQPALPAPTAPGIAPLAPSGGAAPAASGPITLPPISAPPADQ